MRKSVMAGTALFPLVVFLRFPATPRHPGGSEPSHMDQHSLTQSSISRRDLLKGAAGLAGATLLGCEEESGTGPEVSGGILAPGASVARKRIAIVGGGAGGIA